MRNNFKNSNRLFFSILLLLIFIPLNIFATEEPPIEVPTVNDSMTYFDIHPENYRRWKVKHNFSEDMLKVESKKINEEDNLFKNFKEKHKAEADSMIYQKEEWNCYEIDVFCKDNAGSYGNFVINSKHKRDEDTYNIWPEQFEMYVSRFDETTNTFEEPKKYVKVKNDVEANDCKTEEHYYLVQDYNSSSDGRAYYASVNLGTKRIGKDRTHKDKFRVYVFQGHPEPIPKDLLAGEYEIPLSIRYAFRPGMYSMASDAVDDRGKLIVGNDGSLKLRIKFKPMTNSDPKYTGTTKPIEGHLTDLWTYNSIDDFNNYMNNRTYFSGNKIFLNDQKYLKSTYSRGYYNYPEEFEIPLEYSNGKTNYESQKMFTVRVDAMGSMDPQFNLLMRHKDMTLKKVDLLSGKYESMPLIDETDTMNEGIKNFWENGKFKYTKEEYNNMLADSSISSSKLLNTDIGINPYYEVEFKYNKANITVSYVKGVVGSNGPEEFGLVKINEDKDIRYKTADGKLKPIEILEEEDFTLDPAKTKYKKRITKIRLDNVPLSKLGDLNQFIYLENARLARCYNDSGDMTIGVKPNEWDDPIENMYGINNFDIKKMVLLEKTEPTIKKDELQNKIKEAKAIEKGDKSDADFNTLKEAIKIAEKVLEESTKQEEIDRAVKDLDTAIESFKNKKISLNKNELQNKISEARKITQGNKTDNDFKLLQTAINSAESILNSANEQKQIDEALTNLNTAIETFNNSTGKNTEEQKEKIYNVPVRLMHFIEDKDSMGNKALISPAKVSIKNDLVTIDLTFKGIEVPIGANSFYGHLTNLFTFEENNSRGKAIETQIIEKYMDQSLDGSQKEFPKVFRINMTKVEFENLKDNALYVKVWVDAMDGLAGGEPGAGSQKARLVFDKANMTEVTPGKDTPTPPTPSSPDLGNKEKLIDALRYSANLGGSQYTYESNMRYVNAYNAAMALLSKSNVSENEIKIAIDNLNAAASSLVKNTNNVNNNGISNEDNNSSWRDNNNNGWNNNWRSDSNNSSWVSNKLSWGNNQNNNNNNNQNNGPVTITYEVPVEVLHAHQSGYSMANNAINHTARVEERDGKFRYSVQFTQMKRDFGGKQFTGNLYNLFINDGSKYRADQSSGNIWSWVMNGKYDKINISVWVDAMDEIAGKGPGGGEQDAVLSFNWNNAKEVSRTGGNNNQNNQHNQRNQQSQNQQNQNNSSKSTSKFNDTSGHWAKNSIDYVVEKGYFVGLSETEFGPNKSITRGQFVTVLGRMLNINISDYNTQNFKDVKASTYYSPYITWANKVGIVSGIGEGKFAPDKELTREEMAVMMTKFLKVSGKNLNAKGNENGFKDEKNIATWAKESVKEMARLGVVSGMEDGKFEPKSAFTRAQVAQVLYNIDHN